MPIRCYSTDAPSSLEYYRCADRPSYSSNPILGYELEVAYRSDEGREAVAEALGAAWSGRDLRQFGFSATEYAIHKSDGTIPSAYGAELCTVPATLEEHGRILYAAFPSGRIEGDGEAPRAWGCPQVGMHVHLGLASQACPGQFEPGPMAIRPPHWGMTPLAAGKMLAFFHSPANLRFLETMGGRHLTSFCHQSGSVTPMTAWHRRAFLPWYAEAWQRRMGDRPLPPRNRTSQTLGDVQSHALSATLTGRGTIEVRIFRSSTRIARVMMNLEFVVSVASWARNAGLDEAFDYRNYLRWLSTSTSGSAEYPHLFRWLRRSTTPGARLFRSLYPRLNTRKRKGVA
jgi:hypothetical protein